MEIYFPPVLHLKELPVPHLKRKKKEVRELQSKSFEVISRLRGPRDQTEYLTR